MNCERENFGFSVALTSSVAFVVLSGLLILVSGIAILESEYVAKGAFLALLGLFIGLLEWRGRRLAILGLMGGSSLILLLTVGYALLGV